MLGRAAMPTPTAAADDTGPPPGLLHLLPVLQGRRSRGPRGLLEPGPSADDWQQAADLAQRAPDHQGLRPVRFVHIGPDARAALGELFAQAALHQGRDADGQAQARQRAFAGPGLLAVVACIRDDVPEVPPHEQWISVGAAVMNLLTALHLQGHAAKVLGGSLGREAVVRQALCHAGEQIACWVVAGRPGPEPGRAGGPDAAGTSRGDRPPRRDLLLDWSPPG